MNLISNKMSAEDQRIIRQANTLLKQLNSENLISSVEDLSAATYVSLFEGLCGERLEGIIRNPVSKEDEIHNCQCVINVLASDVLHTSLSHISGADVIKGDREAVLNLLEIFSGLLEYILNKIDTDVSTDGEGDHHKHIDDDPDRVKPEVIDRILERELHRSKTESSPTAKISKPVSSVYWEEEDESPKKSAGNLSDTAALIALGQESSTGLRETTLSSPSKSRATADSTNDIMKEVEDIEKRLEKVPLVQGRLFNDVPVTTSLPSRTEMISMPASKPTDSVPYSLSTGYEIPVTKPSSKLANQGESLSSILDKDYPYLKAKAEGKLYSMESQAKTTPDSQPTFSASSRYYPSTVPPSMTALHRDLYVPSTTIGIGERPTARSRIPHQRSGSFENLESMVEETVAMARAAVDASPTRAKTMLQTLETKYQPGTRPSQTNSRLYDNNILKETRDPIVTSQFTSNLPRRTTSPVRKPEDDRLSDSELTPSKGRRKVSFMDERSLTEEDSSLSYQRTSPSPRDCPTVKNAWVDDQPPISVHIQSPKRKVEAVKTKPYIYTSKPSPVSKRRSDKGSSYLDMDSTSDRENSEYDERLRRKFHEIIDDVLSEDELMPARFKSRSDPRRVKFENITNKERPAYTIRDTQKLLNKERDYGKKKIDFLQKIYQEDLDELVSEAKHELGKEKKATKQTETDFKKKVLTALKKKTPAKTKDAASSRKLHISKQHVVSSKAKKHTASGLIPAAKGNKLTIKDDDDILPLLLKEFPHLHLSLHTWHELWRKGINQIEQVTRAHQEVRRKKSRAKSELEQAERRQEILVNIMKKELEHGQRMKDIKERKKQTLATKNQLHEKRIQSARSRKYYDDYQVRLRSKMLKRGTREEMIFKKLFKEGLDIQKDRIRELRKYAKEQRDAQSKHQRNEVESIENYYRDQFDMLAESITKERHELMIREKAQQKVLEQMKKELRKKMEKEIKDLQEQLCRDDDDAYFRQLDADRVIQDLQMAKYHVKV
ncbi:hypothetical protein KUTeg_021066 [Tegillarca granosa]|uniref:DUF5745 domain-containing protein n=1 Tax=Tegillarca granosa TaxID=220873 RepID=A0ABQ9E9Q1_TEGGR|nr:hypothetical protein KUTeg_021066 [Tegillarca granosa]